MVVCQARMVPLTQEICLRRNVERRQTEVRVIIVASKRVTTVERAEQQRDRQ